MSGDLNLDLLVSFYFMISKVTQHVIRRNTIVLYIILAITIKPSYPILKPKMTIK